MSAPRFLPMGAYVAVAVVGTILAPAQPTQVTSALSLSQVADGSGWRTMITLVNSDVVPINFKVSFWKADGTPLALSLATGNPVTQVSGNIPVAGSTGELRLE